MCRRESEAVMFSITKRRAGYFPNDSARNNNGDHGIPNGNKKEEASDVMSRNNSRRRRRPSIQTLEQVTVHCEELNSDDRAFIVEQSRIGMFKIGTDSYGELAGYIKDVLDRRYGPEWQCIVGKKDAFGSCLSPMPGHYLNFSIGDSGILIFKSN